MDIELLRQKLTKEQAVVLKELASTTFIKDRIAKYIKYSSEPWGAPWLEEGPDVSSDLCVVAAEILGEDLRSWYQLRWARNSGDCHDCGGYAQYMVRGGTWDQAFPDYAQVRVQLVELLGTHFHGLDLCFSCLTIRLGRALTTEDFDLTIPVNSAIVFGIQLGKVAV